MLKHPWITIVIIPIAINLMIVGMYFSGIPFLAHIVVPDMPDVAQRREFGLLENLQNVYLVAMIVMGTWAIKIKPHTWEKVAAALFTVFAAFVFLEEIDYGLHWIEYINGTQRGDFILDGSRNWHNVGERSSVMKGLVTLSCVLLFLLAPFLLNKSNNRLIKYLLPAKQYAVGFIGIVLISRIAHSLADMDLGVEGLRWNIGEFRELGTYYLYMIWSYTTIFKRKLN